MIGAALCRKRLRSAGALHKIYLGNIETPFGEQCVIGARKSRVIAPNDACLCLVVFSG